MGREGEGRKEEGRVGKARAEKRDWTAWGASGGSCLWGRTKERLSMLLLYGKILGTVLYAWLALSSTNVPAFPSVSVSFLSLSLLFRSLSFFPYFLFILFKYFPYLLLLLLLFVFVIYQYFLLVRPEGRCRVPGAAIEKNSEKHSSDPSLKDNCPHYILFNILSK